MTPSTNSEISEQGQALIDRAWWRQAGEALGLELRGWTFRDSALFADRETGRSVDLPGSVAERLNRRSANSAVGGGDLDAAGLEAAEIAWTGDRRLGLYPEQKAALANAIAAYISSLHPTEGAEPVWQWRMRVRSSTSVPWPSWGEWREGRANVSVMKGDIAEYEERCLYTRSSPVSAEVTEAEHETTNGQPYELAMVLWKSRAEAAETERVQLWNEVRELRASLIVEKAATDTMRMERDADRASINGGRENG